MTELEKREPDLTGEVLEDGGTAVKVISKLFGFTGDAALYELVPPYLHEGDSEELRAIRYVVVSAAVVPFSGPETYIFEADHSGHVWDWTELPGSLRGILDHQKALSGLGGGYVIVTPLVEVEKTALGVKPWLGEVDAFGVPVDYFSMGD